MSGVLPDNDRAAVELGRSPGSMSGRLRGLISSAVNGAFAPVSDPCGVDLIRLGFPNRSSALMGKVGRDRR